MMLIPVTPTGSLDDYTDRFGLAPDWYFEPSADSADGSTGWIVTDAVDQGRLPADLLAAAHAATREVAEWAVADIERRLAELRDGILWVDSIAAREAGKVTPVLDALVAAQQAVGRLSEGAVDLRERARVLESLQSATANLEITNAAVGRSRAAADAHRALVAPEIATLEERRSELLQTIGRGTS